MIVLLTEFFQEGVVFTVTSTHDRVLHSVLASGSGCVRLRLGLTVVIIDDNDSGATPGRKQSSELLQRRLEPGFGLLQPGFSPLQPGVGPVRPRVGRTTASEGLAGEAAGEGLELESHEAGFDFDRDGEGDHAVRRLDVWVQAWGSQVCPGKSILLYAAFASKI